jgi:hypothetical protein
MFVPPVTSRIVVGLSVEVMIVVDLKVADSGTDAPALGTGVAGT